MTTTQVPAAPTRRGTSNSNDRGSSYDRRVRRAWIMATYASEVPGLVRCYRCGCHLYNPDTVESQVTGFVVEGLEINWSQIFNSYQMWTPQLGQRTLRELTIDRIIPGCKGGTYRRNNIRPACGGCNSETGGALAKRSGK